MSHEMTAWARKASKGKGLTHGAKDVLWELADCHNAETRQCDPSQEHLAEQCELSRSSVNNHLAALERAGLIKRFQRRKSGSKTQMRTFYILAPDFRIEQDIVGAVSEIWTRQPESKNGPDPCPKAESKIWTGTLEPEPGKEPCVSEGRESIGFSAFWDCHPRKRDRERCRELFDAAITAGADPGQITAAARSYAAENRGNAAQYLKFADTWLEDERWRDTPLPSTLDRSRPVWEHEIDNWADPIRRKAAGEPVFVSQQLSETAKRLMVERGMVTVEQIAAAGLRRPSA